MTEGLSLREIRTEGLSLCHEIPPKFAGRPPVSLATKERKEHKDLDSDSLRSFAFFCGQSKIVARRDMTEGL